MADIVSKQVRSRMMSGIRGKDTQPEKLLRSYLFQRGFRYRLHQRKLPGAPDIVFPRHRAVIFVNGCFWHCHQGCSYFRLPATNRSFWKEKLKANVRRDALKSSELLAAGWRVLVFWECATRDVRRFTASAKHAERWIRRGATFRELPAKHN
jgi:DNA mismatch endonuclease (patch repair protein)